jgi:hypothetical protein
MTETTAYEEDTPRVIERGAQLAKFHRLWNTGDGKAQMDDLEVAWGSANVFSSDPLVMAYNAGLLEAFRQLKAFQQAKELER